MEYSMKSPGLGHVFEAGRQLPRRRPELVALARANANVVVPRGRHEQLVDHRQRRAIIGSRTAPVLRRYQRTCRFEHSPCPTPRFGVVFVVRVGPDSSLAAGVDSLWPASRLDAHVAMRTSLAREPEDDVRFAPVESLLQRLQHRALTGIGRSHRVRALDDAKRDRPCNDTARSNWSATANRAGTQRRTRSPRDGRRT